MKVIRVTPKDLRAGDKISGHESGWLTVKKVESNCLYIVVTVDSMFGEKELSFSRFEDSIEVIRG